MIGKTLAVRYEINAQVNDGPMFRMYSARDRLTGRNVGIREIKEPFNSEVSFINALAKSLPSLQVSHPALEFLHEVVEEEHQRYLISEMPKGSLLTERIKRFAPFTVPVSLATTQGILEGLDVLHQAGIAHGDVGAHNVIATPDGSAKLQLGGVWKTYSESRTAGAAVLPLMDPYLAPEVCQGANPSAQSDLYSVGIVLFQLLTGNVPFIGETPTATTVRHLQSPVPSLRGLNASIPVAVEMLVHKLLAKNPDDRYQSAKDVLNEVNTIIDQIRFGKNPAVRKDTGSSSPVMETVPKLRKSAGNEKFSKPKPKLEPSAEKTKRVRDGDIPSWLLGLLAVTFLSALGVIIAFVVFLTQKPREMKMPNIVGVNVNKAREDLRKLKLNLKIVSKEASDRVDINKIMQTSPEPGQMVRENGTVDVVVSSGTRIVQVPNLLGMTADEAKEGLGALNLEIDGKPSRITDLDHPAGSIVRQLPEPDKSVPRFSKIRIWIAAPEGTAPDSLPGETETPPSVAARSFVLNHVVKGVDWNVSVRIEIEDESGTRKVYEKRHDPGDKITVREIGYGTKATFRVYYDEDLREEKEVAKSTRPATGPVNKAESGRTGGNGGNGVPTPQTP